MPKLLYYDILSYPRCLFAGMPANVDRLWLYEHFSGFGAIAGMEIFTDELTGLCNGTW
jgi:hypothetical protein